MNLPQQRSAVIATGGRYASNFAPLFHPSEFIHEINQKTYYEDSL